MYLILIMEEASSGINFGITFESSVITHNLGLIKTNN